MVAPRGLLGEGLVESVRSVLKRSCGPRAFEEATYKPGELLFRSVHKLLSIAHGRFGRALGVLLNHGGNALGFGSNRLGITLGFDPQLLDADKRTTDRVVLRAELVELTLERLNAVEQLIAFGRQRAIALFNAGEKSVGGGSVVASKRRRKFVLGTQADSPRISDADCSLIAPLALRQVERHMDMENRTEPDAILEALGAIRSRAQARAERARRRSARVRQGALAAAVAVVLLLVALGVEVWRGSADAPLTTMASHGHEKTRSTARASTDTSSVPARANPAPTSTTAPGELGSRSRKAPPAASLSLQMSATRGDSSALVRAGSPSGAVLYSGVVRRGTSVTVHARRLWARFGVASNLDFRLNGKPAYLHHTGTVDAVVSNAGLAAARVTEAPPVHPGNAVGPLCGNLAGTNKPATIEHVVWIFMENKSEGPILHAHADPFIRTLASACGLASNYHNITHPSLPNYLAATSGSTHGAASDCRPIHCLAPGPSIFSQLDAAHESWRSYVENMPVPCDPKDHGVYAAKHNTAAYYAALGGACETNDLPLEGSLAHDLATGRLPAFSMIVPNTCDDMHSCPISQADAWLHTWVGRIAATPAYQAGDVVVFITWDEGRVRNDIFGENCAQHLSDQSCHVAMLVLSEHTRPGTVDSTLYTHYSLLLTTEQLLHLHGRLGAAANPRTHSLRDPFGL